MRAILRTLASALFALSIGGCSADDDGSWLVTGRTTGTFVQTWSIEGQKDATKCAQYNADRMRFVLYDQEGSVQATELAPCSAFSLRLSLVQRSYSGAATFLDANGDAINETIRTAPFIVLAAREVTRNIDFSADQMRRP